MASTSIIKYMRAKFFHMVCPHSHGLL